MLRFLSKLARKLQTAKTARAPRRPPRRAIPQLEGLEDRMVPSTAAPLNPVGFQPAIAVRPFVQSLFSPDQIRTAYSINNSTATGSGQTIAIVDAYNDPTIFNDVDVFDHRFPTNTGTNLFQRYGAASSFLTVYNQAGQMVNPAGYTGIPVDKTGHWEVETALDVEWAHAIAPGARIALVETNSDDTDLLQTLHSQLADGIQTAKQLPGVSVVSMSFGVPEFNFPIISETNYEGIFTTPAGHTGVTFLAAAGDHSYGQYPAFSPNVIAVGGTTLPADAIGNPVESQEVAWSTGSDPWDLTLGTGGGTSAVEGEPSYQQGFQSTGRRTAPDVSFDADPNTGVFMYDSFGGSAGASGWTTGDGTSLATPCWAGLMAMANQQRVAAGLPTLNSSSPTEAQTLLYGLAGVAFHDITSGLITANGHTYNAGPGYNEVTGGPIFRSTPSESDARPLSVATVRG
jgi:subtilase family serine protease